MRNDMHLGWKIAFGVIATLFVLFTVACTVRLFMGVAAGEVSGALPKAKEAVEQAVETARAIGIR